MQSKINTQTHSANKNILESNGYTHVQEQSEVCFMCDIVGVEARYLVEVKLEHYLFNTGCANSSVEYIFVGWGVIARSNSLNFLEKTTMLACGRQTEWTYWR